MGYNDDFDGFDFDDDNRGSGGGRGLDEVRAAYKALKKKYGELETAHQSLTGQVAQRNLKDVLAEKGLRPGLARVIAKEDVDLTDSKAIEAWLSDPANQEDFVFSLDGGAATSGGGTNDGTNGADGAGGYAADLAQFQNAGNGALPAGDALVSQYEERLAAAKTPAEKNAILAEASKHLK